MKENIENNTVELSSAEFWEAFDKMLWEGMNFVIFFSFAHYSFSNVDSTGFELVFKHISGYDVSEDKMFLARGTALKEVTFNTSTNGFHLILENGDEADVEFMKRFNATSFLPEQ